MGFWVNEVKSYNYYNHITIISSNFLDYYYIYLDDVILC